MYSQETEGNLLKGPDLHNRLEKVVSEHVTKQLSHHFQEPHVEAL